MYSLLSIIDGMTLVVWCGIMLIGMELVDMPHKKDAKQLNRLIHVTGHWAQPLPEPELRDLFRSLVRGSIIESPAAIERGATTAMVRYHIVFLCLYLYPDICIVMTKT
jgi:hypothetical protein